MLCAAGFNIRWLIRASAEQAAKAAKAFVLVLFRLWAWLQRALGEREHRADNLQLFSFALDDEDRALLNAAFAATTRIPGDCGDEYRRPPFLTASGDLSQHLAALPPVWPRHAVPGYARAVRSGRRILVSGTTATHGSGRLVGRGDAAAQTVYILDKIAASITALGGRLEDVLRTRVYLADVADWEAVSRVHGRYFGEIRPANTLLQVGALVGDGYRVEIEAEAEVAG